MKASVIFSVIFAASLFFVGCAAFLVTRKDRKVDVDLGVPSVDLTTADQLLWSLPLAILLAGLITGFNFVGWRVAKARGLWGLLAILACVDIAKAGDWPQILGPQRNGRAADDERIAGQFPDGGPRIIWKVKVGQGHAGPAVADGSIIVFHRLDHRETVECLDAATGERRWSFDYPTDYRDDFGFDEGPRAVPTIHNGRIYTYGAAGMLHALDLTSGQPVWSVDTVKRFGSRKGFFGRACSPLVDGDLLIVQVGGIDGSGIVAFEKESGDVRWTATDDEAGYSSPTAATINGRRLILALTREGLVTIDPADGAVLFRKRFRSSTHASVNAATPVVLGHHVFLTASYNTGAALWHLAPTGAREVWANDQTLSSQYTTPVPHDGFLYGLHGRQDAPPRPMLRCIEIETGRPRWSTEPLGAGSLILADAKLVVLTEDGELILAPASPAGFRPTARAQILGFHTRALPALSNGRFYARDPKQLICVDLRPQAGQ